MPNATAADPSLLLEIQRVTKTFPGVTALQDVDFDLRSGEIHVLIGENGAGKSTLIYTTDEMVVDQEMLPTFDQSDAVAPPGWKPPLR